MVIFSEIVLFAVVVFGIFRLVTNEIRIKVLKAQNQKLIDQNEELRELLLSDEADRIGRPPVGKKILYG